jgi:HD-like signal output (HDOD) protein
VAVAFKKVPGLDMHQFWGYSLDTAKLSRKLAREVRVNEATAFTAGLIHATGELVMHLGMPEQMQWLNDQALPFSAQRHRAERHLLGYHYADVGAGFAQSWAFPKTIVEAIAHQIAPFDGGNYEPMAGIVHLAAWRARARQEGLNPSAMAVCYPAEVALNLGIDIDHVLEQEASGWATSQEVAEMAQ